MFHHSGYFSTNVFKRQNVDKDFADCSRYRRNSQGSWYGHLWNPQPQPIPQTHTTIKKQGWHFWSERVSFSGHLLFNKHWCQQSALWNVWVIFLTSWFGRHRLFGRSKNWVAKMSPDHSLSPSCCSLRLSWRFLQQQKSLWLEAGSVFFFGLMGIFGWIKHPLGFFPSAGPLSAGSHSQSPSADFGVNLGHEQSERISWWSNQFPATEVKTYKAVNKRWRRGHATTTRGLTRCTPCRLGWCR